MSNPDRATTTSNLTCPNRVEAEARHHLGDLRDAGPAVGPPDSTLRPCRHHPSVLDDLFLQEHVGRMRAASMAVRSWPPANRRAVELGAQSRTDAWPSVFPGAGEPGCAPAPSRPRPHHRGGHAPRFGHPVISWKETGVFLLIGPAYLRKPQVQEVLGVSARQITAWCHAGFLHPQLLSSGEYGYRAAEVARLANTPGPVATWVRGQMYRERRERCACVSACLRQAHPDPSRMPR